MSCEPADQGRRAPSMGDAGYVILLSALLMVPLLIFVGFAVDIGAWYAQANREQKAVDAAALAGVTWLPNQSEARAAALAIVAKNGFDPTEVTVTFPRPRAVQVNLLSPADLYFSQLSGIVPADFSIERQAVGEYILPVPMGSPRNYLGTGNLFSGATEPPQDQFWVSVSGYCARREHGDRMTPRTDSNGGTANTDFEGCDQLGAASTTQMGANPEFTGRYFYAIELDNGDLNPDDVWPFQPRVDIFDAAHCQANGSVAFDSGSNNLNSDMWGTSFGAIAGERRYNFRLRANDSPLVPENATVISEVLNVGPNDCLPADADPAYANQWQSFGLLTEAGGSPPREGVYFLEIEPVVPTDQNGQNSQEGQNNMALRVVDPDWGNSNEDWPCTFDPATEALPAVEQRDDCPRIYGVTHLGVYVRATGGEVLRPYLAAVGPEHAGKVMQIELFDAAEGMNTIEILDPRGDPITFDWEIACQDGTVESDGVPCTDNANDPQPLGMSGRGPFVDQTQIAVAGNVPTGSQTYGANNSQTTRFSDRIIRIEFDLPTVAEEPDWYDGNDWFRIRYTAPSTANLQDRTTWSVSIVGDPIRLAE